VCWQWWRLTFKWQKEKKERMVWNQRDQTAGVGPGLLCLISHAAVAVGELAKGLIYILREWSQRVGEGIEGGVGVGFRKVIPHRGVFQLGIQGGVRRQKENNTPQEIPFRGGSWAQMWSISLVCFGLQTGDGWRQGVGGLWWKGLRPYHLQPPRHL
jgi:hypothetical protein